MRNKCLYIPDHADTTPFTSAEEAWFWYCLCQQLDANRSRESKAHIIRPCESSDIFLAIKKLIRAGLLQPKHIKVLAKYGLLQTPPHPHFGDSLSICSLWQEALRFLDSLLRRKGIVA